MSLLFFRRSSLTNNTGDLYFGGCSIKLAVLPEYCFLNYFDIFKLSLISTQYALYPVIIYSFILFVLVTQDILWKTVCISWLTAPPLIFQVLASERGKAYCQTEVLAMYLRVNLRHLTQKRRAIKYWLVLFQRKWMWSAAVSRTKPADKCCMFPLIKSGKTQITPIVSWKEVFRFNWL